MIANTPAADQRSALKPLLAEVNSLLESVRALKHKCSSRGTGSYTVRVDREEAVEDHRKPNAEAKPQL